MYPLLTPVLQYVNMPPAMTTPLDFRDPLLMEIRRAIRERHGDDKILHLDNHALVQVLADDKKLRYSILHDERLYRALLVEREVRLQQAVISEEEPQSAELPPPPLDDLRHLLETRFPVLYAQVLEPTLADLYLDYSATLVEGRPWKARRVLLQGYGALAAAAICQLGFSLLGRIAAFWQARSPK